MYRIMDAMFAGH